MPDVRDQILKQVNAAPPSSVWAPADFAALGSRAAIDKALQRMANRGELRRIDRGLYDRPRLNRLTRQPAAPDYRAVVDALARRDQSRILIDGMTAANDLGFTDAVPARVTLYSDLRRRSIQLGSLFVEFKLTAPSRLYWAGRPAMRVVQALYWLKDMLPSESNDIRQKLTRLFADARYGSVLQEDLIQGFGVLPAWMQAFLRTVPGFDPTCTPPPTRSDASSAELRGAR